MQNLARTLIIIPLCLLTACVGNAPASYPPINKTIVDTKEWRMPLNREPGRVQLKLHFANKDVSAIALLPAREYGEGPIRLVFSGGECSAGPEAYIKFYTSPTESFFKYFRAPLQWGSDIDVSIEWDKNTLTSIVINGEKIDVPAYIPFETLRFTSHHASTKIKEVTYAPLTAMPPSTTQGLTQ